MELQDCSRAAHQLQLRLVRRLVRPQPLGVRRPPPRLLLLQAVAVCLHLRYRRVITATRTHRTATEPPPTRSQRSTAARLGLAITEAGRIDYH